MLSQSALQWLNEAYSKISEIKQEQQYVYLRGQGKNSDDWTLIPKIARPKYGKAKSSENELYLDFKTRSELILGKKDSWETLFEMQHYGLPTRLLDWSESFNAALYFAIFEDKYLEEDGVVWILNPFYLNINQALNMGVPVLPLVMDKEPFDYYEHVIGHNVDWVRKTKFSEDFRASFAIAVFPIKTNFRLMAQQSAFTLHNNLNIPLEVVHKENQKKSSKKYLEKIIVPKSLKNELRTLLKLNGVNQYSLFPDVEGLVGLLLEKYSE